MMSIQTRSKSQITDVPLSSILRPILPVIDDSKVDSMICTLSRRSDPSIDSNDPDAPRELPPVDVLHYKSKTKGDMYFAFGGCHRLRAHDVAGVEMVRCKVVPATKGILRMYLGASVDRITGD